jgi:hypothetical protein
MTKYNLLQEIKNYSDLAYQQGFKIGKRFITPTESRQEDGLKRAVKFEKIAKIVSEICPAESIEAINRFDGNHP